MWPGSRPSGPPAVTAANMKTAPRCIPKATLWLLSLACDSNNSWNNEALAAGTTVGVTCHGVTITPENNDRASSSLTPRGVPQVPLESGSCGHLARPSKRATAGSRTSSVCPHQGTTASDAASPPGRPVVSSGIMTRWPWEASGFPVPVEALYVRLSEWKQSVDWH